MDKLIIIGNGFDLAHGLKTSYRDFASDYLKNIYNTIQETGEAYIDDLLQINSVRSASSPPVDYFKWFEQQPGNHLESFWRSILSHPNYGWVDIETEFFQHILNSIDDNGTSFIMRIRKLNNDFEVIKKLLIDYLKKEEFEKQITPNEEYLQFFLNGIDNRNTVYFLNFNYTRTVEKYSSACRQKLNNQFKESNYYSSNTQNIQERCSIINNIHGTLEDNNVIFGIGDEHHEKYNKLKESIYLHDILKYSKSFFYPLNNNYTSLLNFLESTPGHINVEVYGHSCGLSDRTLLKYIFQHEKIYRIKLFYHKDEENFIKQSINRYMETL